MSKERPIIFDAESVRAILAGRKTQTRRVIKPQPPSDTFGFPLPKCPYGQPGDRLWVRETFTTRGNVFYRANGEMPDQYRQTHCWHSPIHMPRRFSRITLEVVSIDARRLWDISLDDVLAEGIEPDMHDSQYWRENTGIRFEERWDAINDKKTGCAWRDTPWVWCISFRRID